MLGPAGSGRGRAPVLDALLTTCRRLWGRRVQRQPQEPVADRAVARHMPVRRRGRQVRAEQGPRLVPDRCRHTPPPGVTRGMCPVFGVPSESDAVKAARGRQRAAEGFRVAARTGGLPERPRTRRSPAPIARCGALAAVLTGFEPAASTLTGWRALQTAPQDQVSRRLFCVALREETVQEGGPPVELTLRASSVTPRVRARARRWPSRSACRRPGTPCPARGRNS